MRRAGIVLCGGRSRRMGRPKALLPWFGRTMVEHVVASLAPCVDELLVVTSRDVDLAPLALDARILFDREPGRGPLAALRDGLAAARADFAFVTACDAPFLTAEFVERLFDRTSAAANARAVAPIAEGFVQVLSAVYPVRAWRDAETLLSEGISSPTALLERVGFARLEAGSAASDRIAPWIGFNTPDAYLALARQREPGATARVDWEGVQRTVPIGRLAEVLERATPTACPSDSTPSERLARGDLRVVLAEGALGRGADPWLPIGPDEQVSVFEAPDGDPH